MPFLVTPVDGIEDLYVKAGLRWPEPPLGQSATATLIYHEFETEEGGRDLGTELDAILTVKMDGNWSAAAAAAFFDGDTDGPADRTKVWGTLQYRY